MQCVDNLFDIRLILLSGSSSDEARWKKYENFLFLKGLKIEGENVDQDIEKKCRYMYQHLQGNAEAWYNGLTPTERGSWKNLKEAFEKRYTSKSGKYSQEIKLEARKLEPTETVSQYIDDVLIQCRKLGKSNSETQSALIRGLPQQMQCFVYSHEPKGLTAHIDKIKLAEYAMPRSSSALASVSGEKAKTDLSAKRTTTSAELSNLRTGQSSNFRVGADLKSIQKTVQQLSERVKKYEEESDRNPYQGRAANLSENVP